MLRNILRARSPNPPVGRQSPRAQHKQGDVESKGSHTPAVTALGDCFVITNATSAPPDPPSLSSVGAQPLLLSKTDSLHGNGFPAPFSNHLEHTRPKPHQNLHHGLQEHPEMQGNAVQQQQELLQEWQQEHAAACAAEQVAEQQGDKPLDRQQTQEAAPRQLMSSRRDSLAQQRPSMDGVRTIQQLQTQLNLQQKAREELEDMLLRYERQLKAESAARCAAEQKAQAAAVAADEARQQLASSGRQAKQRTASLAAEEEAMRQERAALENMRVDFERQLQSARAEVRKAQAAMRSTEERVRAAEATEQVALVSEYEARIASLMAELERLRAELTHRTSTMTAEMKRWKHQAALTAAAVVEAKNEVMERQRELHSTNTKMDHLIERLYGHREASIVLSGAIAAAAEHQQAATNSFLQQQAATGAYAALHTTGGIHPMHHMSLIRQTACDNKLTQACTAALDSQSLQDTVATAAVHGSSAYNKAGYSSTAKGSGSRASNALVPTTMQQGKAAKGQQQHSAQHSDGDVLHCHGPVQEQLPSPSWPHAQLSSAALVLPPSSPGKIPQPFLAAAMKGANLSTAGPACTWLPSAQPSTTIARKAASSIHKASAQHQPQQQQCGGVKVGRSTSTRSRSPKAAGSYAVLHQQQQQQQPGPGPAAAAVAGALNAKAGGVYACTGSRYAEAAAKHVQASQPKAKQEAKQRGKQPKPDRFAEGAKNAAMVTAMASRW